MLRLICIVTAVLCEITVIPGEVVEIQKSYGNLELINIVSNMPNEDQPAHISNKDDIEHFILEVPPDEYFITLTEPLSEFFLTPD